MRRLASIFLITGFLLILPLSPVHLSAGSNDFQNLEFFLERALKNSKDSTERVEIVNRSAPDDTKSYPFKGCQMVPTMIILSGGLNGTVRGTVL
jgi:hypothetical protein